MTCWWWLLTIFSKAAPFGIYLCTNFVDLHRFLGCEERTCELRAHATCHQAVWQQRSCNASEEGVTSTMKI